MGDLGKFTTVLFIASLLGWHVDGTKFCETVIVECKFLGVKKTVPHLFQHRSHNAETGSPRAIRRGA